MSERETILDEPTFDDLAADLEDEDEPEEPCNCISPTRCATYLVGRCDGQRHRIPIRRAAFGPRELTGRLTFDAAYDPELFDE